MMLLYDFSQGLRDTGRTDTEPLGYGVRCFHFEDLALITRRRLSTENAGVSKLLKCTKHLDPPPAAIRCKDAVAKTTQSQQQEKTAG